MMQKYLYYLDLKNSHKGSELEIRRIKVRAIYGGKVNGKVPLASCFKKPSDAINVLDRASEFLKNDLTTQLIDAFDNINYGEENGRTKKES